jgi:hypothetical protein
MKISIDWNGCYMEHKEYFDEMAKALQKAGHQVGILTGERERDPYDKRKSKRDEIMKDIGFAPDFVYLWGEYETIANGNMWKAERMVENEIMVHYDDDAAELKSIRIYGSSK